MELVQQQSHGTVYKLGASIVAILATSVSGTLYGILVAYNPIVYLSLIALLVAVLFSAGLIKNATVNHLQIHNRLLRALVGTLFGLVFLYCAWVAWVYFFSSYNKILLNPFDIWQYAQFKAETGVWSISGETASRWEVYAAWSGEAAMVLGYTVHSLVEKDTADD